MDLSNDGHIALYQEDILHDSESDTDSDGSDFIPEQYDSDYEEPELVAELQPAAQWDSDSESDTEFELAEGYDSDTDYRERPSMHWRRNDACESEPPQPDNKIEAMFEQNRLEERRLLRAAEEQLRIDKEELEREQQALQQANGETESEETKVAEVKLAQEEWEREELVSFPTSMPMMNMHKTWTEAEVASMHANKWFKLGMLLTTEQYLGPEYASVLFAFKNEPTLNDNQRMFMLSTILEVKHGHLSELDRSVLAGYIARKTYNRGYKHMLSTKWPAIMSLVREANEIEYARWEKEQRAISRQARIEREASLLKETNSVYRFMNRLGEADFGRKIVVGDLYQRYVQASAGANDILSAIAFGKLISKYGIKAKVVKLSKQPVRAYDLNTDSVSAWLIAYQV